MRSVFAALVCKRARRRLNKLCASFVREDRGSVAITMGISLAVLMGMAALGTEVSSIQYKQRQMQAVADAAALSAALAYTKGVPSDFKLEGQAIAASSGFVNGAANTVVTINRPPASGAHSANNEAIEVIIEQPQTLKLAGLFTSAKFNVGARAVALQGQSSGSFCVLSTDTGASEAVTVTNGARLTGDDCGFAVNSTGTPALSVAGGARVEATSVSVAGTVSVHNNGVLTAPGGVLQNQPATADPYAGVDVPIPNSPCVKSVGSWVPGTLYCEMNIDKVKASLSPGTYFVKDKFFVGGGNSELTGKGVTIVLTKDATATIAGGGTISLTAPTAGPTAGIIFFGDRNVPNNNVIDFRGGAKMLLNGALYLPSRSVIYSNNDSNSSDCTQLIAWRITFDGGSRFRRNCQGTGVSPIGGSESIAQLVE